MSPKKRRGVRGKKKEDTVENQDSVNVEDSPSSSQSLVKTNVEKEEKDIVSSVRRSSRRKTKTTDDLLQLQSSPSLSSPIIGRNRRSIKFSNDSVEALHEKKETEESMEVDEKNERIINFECDNEKDTHGEKESLGQSESMEVDDNTQVIDSCNTNLSEESIEFLGFKTEKIKGHSGKLTSLGDTVQKTEVKDPSSSEVSNSKMDIEGSKLELAKGPSALKSEVGSLEIKNVSSNDENKNVVTDNSVEIEKVNVKEMCDIHNQNENIIEKTSTETVCKASIPILSIDNQKDSADIDMVSVEEVKVDKEDTSTKLSGESPSENAVVSDVKIGNFETVNENNLLTPSGNVAQKESSSSIKLFEKSDSSVEDTPAVSSDEIMTKVCDKIESSELLSSSPAKNNTFPSSKENMKNEKALKNKSSDSSNILLIDISSEIDSDIDLDSKIAVPEKENVKKMDVADNFNEKEPTNKSSNLQNEVTDKMETLEPVTFSKTSNTQEVKPESVLIDDENIKLDSLSKSSEIFQNEVTDSEIKITKNYKEENENGEMTYKCKKVEGKPNKESIEKIKAFESQIEDKNGNPAIPESEADKNTNPSVTSNAIDNNSNRTASKTKVDKNAEPAAASEAEVNNEKDASVSKTESMETEEKTQRTDSSFTSLLEENIESSEKKSTKKFKELRVKLVPLEDTLKKLNDGKPVATIKEMRKNVKPAASKMEVNKNEKPATTSESEVNKNVKPTTSKMEINKNKKLTTTSESEVNKNVKPATSQMEVNKNKKPATTSKSEVKKKVKSAAISKTGDNEKANSSFKTDVIEILVVDDNSDSLIKEIKNIESSEKKITENVKECRANLVSPEDTNKKVVGEKIVAASKKEAGSDSQKNKIPGRGFIIGTRGVAEDGKKTLFDCVLCFSGEDKYGVPGAILNKHIKTKEHALKAMEIENQSLYKQFKDDSNAKSDDVINAILEYEETQKRQSLVLASKQSYDSQRQFLLKKIAYLKQSNAKDAKADGTMNVSNKKKTLNAKPVQAVPAKVPAKLNTLSFLSSLKKKDNEKEKLEPKVPVALNNEKEKQSDPKVPVALNNNKEKRSDPKVPVALNTLSFLSTLKKKDQENEKPPEADVPVALNTLSFLSTLKKKDKENEKPPEAAVPVALNTLSFLSTLKKKDQENEKQPEADVPVALNTLSFLSTLKKKDSENENVKQLKENFKIPTGKDGLDTLSQQLAERQKNRNPDKIVLVMDYHDVFLSSEKLGDNVRIIRKRDLDFAKAVGIVKSDVWFGKGTLFLFLGGVFSAVKVQKHPTCAQNNCEFPVHIYQIEKDTPANIIIKGALQLQKILLDATTNDQALFCDIVPVNVDNNNFFKIQKRLCYSEHPISAQYMDQYIAAVNEFNKFVNRHTGRLGFKFESLVEGTFGRVITDVKYAFGYLSSDGVTLNEIDYKRRCLSILSKVEGIRKRLNGEACKVDPITGKNIETSSEKRFDKVAIIANSYYKETLTQFSSDKVIVYADEDLKFEGIEQFILEKKKNLPERTLWLTLIGSFCISEIKYHDTCLSKLSCKEPLITLVPSPNVQNLSSLPETIRKIKESTLALLKIVRSLIGPKSMFFIIPPYPPTIVSELSFTHHDLHNMKCSETQIYVASEDVITHLNSAFTKLSKEIISLVKEEFQNYKLKCTSVESYRRSLPFDSHLKIVRHGSDNNKSKLFHRWKECVNGMISEYIDNSLKHVPVPVPVRITKRFDHFVFIGHQNMLNQLSDRTGAKFSIFNVNYPINFEFLQMKLSSLKSISDKPMLFVIACDFSLIAKDVYDAKCKSLRCVNMMSYFTLDSKDIKAVIAEKLLDIRKMISKIKDTYPVNATVIIAPLFSRHCVERPTEINETVHRTLHVILKSNCYPCIVEGSRRHWEDGISLLQFYLKDEILNNLYIRNQHELLTDAVESFLSLGPPYIQWNKPVVTPISDKFKYSIKILFNKLRDVAYTIDLNSTAKTKGPVTVTSIESKQTKEIKKSIPVVNSTGKSKTTGNQVSTDKKGSDVIAKTTNQPFNATASQNTSTNYQIPSTPYNYNEMSSSYNAYGNGMNQGFYPSNSYPYYIPNQPTSSQQMSSAGLIQQLPPLAQVLPPLAQVPPPLGQIPPPVYPYQFPPPQQEVAQQQYLVSTDSSYSNNFFNQSSSVNYTQSHIPQPSISDMLSSSASAMQSVSGSNNASGNANQSATVIRSVVKNIIIGRPMEIVDFLSEFGNSAWRCQPCDYSFVIGKKEMIEPLLSHNLQNVKFIYQNLASMDEGQVSYLIKKIGVIPPRSICFLAFDMSIILENILVGPGCKKFKCKHPISCSCLKTQSHLSQQMNIIIRIKDIVNLATKIAGYIHVVVLPVYPTKVFVDDSSSFMYHKISHAINDSNSYILTGEKKEWEDCIETFLQTWNNFMKVHHDKYTYPKSLPKFPYLRDTITIGDKVNDFFEEDNQPVIWENTVMKIIKILMTYAEGSNIEKTITITKTEETTINSEPSSTDTSSQTVVKVWNFSDSIPEKFFDYLFRSIDPNSNFEKHFDKNDCSYLVKLTKVSAILITRKLDNILIGDSTLRVSLISDQDDYPQLSFAQEKYILSMFQGAYSRYKSQIFKNIRNKLTNVIDFTNYKTSKCKGICHGDTSNCNLYHNENDRRRNPMRYTYLQKMCISQGLCGQGDACSSAHNIYEQMFYPTNFQTILCPMHDNNNPITTGFCKFAHKNSPELFFTGSWQDIVTFGTQNSIRFLMGAIRAIHKLTLRTDVKICFISQSEEFLETVFKIIDHIAFQQYTLKCVRLEEMKYNTNTYDVYLGKLSTVYNYPGKILSINDYGVLIVDDINSIMKNGQDTEYLLKICQRLKISAGLRSPINKVFVSSSYDHGVTGIVSRFLGIPLLEVKDSDIHPERKLASELDTKYSHNERSKDIIVLSSRSRSRSRSYSRSRTGRSRRSVSRSRNRRSGSRSRRRRSRSLKRRSLSRSRRTSRSRSRRRSRSRSVTRSHRRSSSRSRRSRSKSKTRKISSKRKHSLSPQNIKAKKRAASPKEETFHSSSKMPLTVEKSVPSVKTLGEELFRKFVARKASLHNSIEEEYKAYKSFPELHPNYEMHYEEFLSDYYKRYGMNTKEDHTEGFWIVFWAQKVKGLKEAEIDKKTKELEKEFLSKVQPKNVASQSTTSASDTFSIENTFKLLEGLSSELGMLGPAISAIINSARESGPTTSKGLSVITDKENLVLIKMVIEKLNSLQKTCSSSQLPKLIKGAEWTQKVIEYAKNPQKKQGLNLMAIAKASLGKDSGFTLNLIKTALAYEGMSTMSKEEINQLFLKVCSLHFEMAMQDK